MTPLIPTQIGTEIKVPTLAQKAGRVGQASDRLRTCHSALQNSNGRLKFGGADHVQSPYGIFDAPPLAITLERHLPQDSPALAKRVLSLVNSISDFAGIGFQHRRCVQFFPGLRLFAFHQTPSHFEIALTKTSSVRDCALTCKTHLAVETRVKSRKELSLGSGLPYPFRPILAKGENSDFIRTMPPDASARIP